MRYFVLDVDGVAADFVPHALNILGLTHIPPATVPQDFRDILSTEDKEKYEHLLTQPEFWLTLPVMDGAQDRVEKLRIRDIQVHWCSSPFDTAPLWHWARTQWLKKNFNSPLEDFFPVKKKWAVWGDFMMDDSSDNVVGWKKKWPVGKAFLFDQPHNRAAKDLVEYGIQRVSSWENLGLYIS